MIKFKLKSNKNVIIRNRNNDYDYDNRKESYLTDFWKTQLQIWLIEAVALQKSVSFILKFLFVSLFWFIYLLSYPFVQRILFLSFIPI